MRAYILYRRSKKLGHWGPAAFGRNVPARIEHATVPCVLLHQISSFEVRPDLPYGFQKNWGR